ncbi:MAG TPA: DUF3850 domain-containing protein [Candidatus Obscuribacterales bacterium]
MTKTINDHCGLKIVSERKTTNFSPEAIEHGYVCAHEVLDRFGAQRVELLEPQVADEPILARRITDFMYANNLFVPKLHQLRTESEFYKAIENGSKRFEIRQNDRNFKPNDYLRLDEIAVDPDNGRGTYTGQSLIARVGYVMADERFVKAGYCVMQLKEVWALHSFGN